MPQQSKSKFYHFYNHETDARGDQFYAERKKRRGRSRSSRKKRYGVSRKSLKIRPGNNKKKVKEGTEATLYERGSIPLTPQMIRWSIKELNMKRVYVRSSLIADHLQRCYPVESDPKTFKEELNDKLDAAVCAGLIVKCGEDAYCLPTFRREATSQRSDFNTFWERYNVI